MRQEESREHGTFLKGAERVCVGVRVRGDMHDLVLLLVTGA